ncbi:MAG: hypothetical protein IJM75_09025 [Ruminococcus sp.]|nr:hypothetical protein [Ruminococcus sp.]
MPKQIDRNMLKKLKDLNKAGNYDALVQYICEQTLTLSTNHDDMSLYDTVNEFYEEILRQFDEKSKANVLEIGKAFTRYDVRTFMEAGKEADKVAEQIKNGEIEELKYVENDKAREKLSAGIVITQSDFTPKLRANKSAYLTFGIALANDSKWEQFARNELVDQKNQETESYKNSFPGIAPKDKERYMKRFIGQVQRLVPIEGFTFNENYKPGQSRITKYPAHYKLLNDANTTEELDKLEKTTAEEYEQIKKYQQGFFDTENGAKDLSKTLEDSTSEEAKKTKEYKELMEAVNLLKAISKGIEWYGIDYDGKIAEKSAQPFSSNAAKYALNQVREKAEAFKGIDENAANAALSFAKSRSDVNQHNYEKNYKPLRDKYDNLDSSFFTPEGLMEHITAIQHKKSDLSAYQVNPNMHKQYRQYSKKVDAINAYAEAVDKIRGDKQLGSEIKTMLDDMADRKTRKAKRTASYDTFINSIDTLNRSKKGIETTPSEYRKSLVDAINACDDYRKKHKGLFNGNFGKGPARYNASISIGDKLRAHLAEFDKAYDLYPASKNLTAKNSRAELIGIQHGIVEVMDKKRKYYDSSMSNAADAHKKYTEEMESIINDDKKPENMSDAEFFAQKKEKFAQLLAKTTAVGIAVKETQKTYDLLAKKTNTYDADEMKQCEKKFTDESISKKAETIKNHKGFKDMIDSITDKDLMEAVLYISTSEKGRYLSEEIERRAREVEAREKQAAEQERRRKPEEENDLLKPAYYDPNNFKPGEIIPYQNDIRDVLSEGEPTSDQDFNTKKDKIMRATAKLISTKASWNLPEKRTISQIRQELGDEGFASYRKEYKKVSKECEKNAQRLYTESDSFKYMFDMVTNWKDLKELSMTALSPTGNGIIFKLRAAKEAYLEAEKIKQQGRISTTKTDPNKTIIPK